MQQDSDLRGTLARALENEEAEARWLAGEDVFAGIAQGAAEVAAAEQAITAILGQLSGLQRDRP